MINIIETTIKSQQNSWLTHGHMLVAINRYENLYKTNP